jgi:hypothetical protein
MKPTYVSEESRGIAERLYLTVGAASWRVKPFNLRQRRTRLVRPDSSPDSSPGVTVGGTCGTALRSSPRTARKQPAKVAISLPKRLAVEFQES